MSIGLHICRYCRCASDVQRWTSRPVMKSIAAILLFALIGCTRQEGLPVQFVVPDGYRGVISVTLDATSGVAVPVTNGQFIVTIPASGKLPISSWDCIGGRHVVSARYTSGQLLPTGHDPNAITLRVVSFRPDTKTALYLVGTEKEAHDAFTKY
jgi:hypothetical protein